jgi:hypothetical protein
MFKLSASERLNRWKTFRFSLAELSIDSAIKQTLDFWDRCPFCPFYLEIENPDTWPNPWQLIEDNHYCDLAKVLGIVYTLHLSKYAKDLYPEIRVYFHPKTRHTYHIAYLCQGKYVLNLVEGEIVNKEHINQELKLKYRYTAADLKLEQY